MTESEALQVDVQIQQKISIVCVILDVLENERKLFYKHMGYRADLNTNIYQTESETLHVDVHLKKMNRQIQGSEQYSDRMQ